MLISYNLRTPENFEKVLKIFKTKYKNFTIESTSFTNTFKSKESRVILNQTGKQDNAIILINAVRRDCEKFLSNTDVNCEYIPNFANKEADINFYFYNDFEGTKQPQGDLLKLDINSAYWTLAVKLGVVSQKTANLYENIAVYNTEKAKSLKAYAKNETEYNEGVEMQKNVKKIRLKALGSLATQKIIETYENGIKNETIQRIHRNEASYNAYLHICNKTAELMMELTFRYNLIYYYWDCLFIQDKGQVYWVEKYLTENGFKFKTENDTYNVFKGVYCNYLETKTYKYPIHKHMIFDWDQQELNFK